MFDDDCPLMLWPFESRPVALCGPRSAGRGSPVPTIGYLSHSLYHA
jgi:hypothetical protein